MRLRLLLAALVAAALMAAPAAASNHEGTVTVVHGVPGLTVDVYVNGDPTLEGFAPGTVTDPLTLPEGTYDIEIYPEGADPDADEPALSGSAELPAGANASIVAHLDEGGDPMLSVFVNDTAALDAGEARIVVRHTAAAPAVDVRADGEVVFDGLANPDEAAADLPAGTLSADVVLAGEDEPVLGPADLTLGEGEATIVYAIGSAEDGSLDLLVQTISGLHGAPSAVETGSGGLAAEPATAATLWAWALVAGGLSAALLGARRVLARVRS